MANINNAAVGQKHAPRNGNAPLSGEAQGKSNMPNDTTLDALTGWFGLGVNVKQSKTRQQKKSWIRGGTR